MTERSRQRVAVRFEGVDKVYRLYNSARELAMDQLGLHRLKFWRPAPEFPEFHALKDLNFTIRHGERWGIVGRNGAGKTTLLRLITQNFLPTRGRVTVQGTVQALMQTGLGFNPEFTGYDNIRAALHYNGLYGRAFEQALQEVCDFVELGDFLHQPVRTYSLGMDARLQFAAATAVCPDVLIIDEVLGAGDGYFATKCAERMRWLTESGCTLILVSHSMQQVLQFCDKAMWMEQGGLVAEGPAAEIVAAYEESFHTDDGMAEPEPDALDEQRRARQRQRMREIPEDFRKPFVVDAIRAAEPLEDQARSELLEVDSHALTRYPGSQSITLTNVELLRFGEPADRLRTGEDATLCLRFEAAEAATQTVRFALFVYDIAGGLLVRAISEPEVLETEPGVPYAAKLDLAPFPLGHGRFMLSAGVFAGEAGFEPEQRIDYLSQCLCARVLESNDSDPPTLHWNGRFVLGAEATEVQARISGVQ